MGRDRLKWAFALVLGMALLSLIPPAERAERVNYEAHAGLNACWKATGAFAGKIWSAFLSNDTWHYVLLPTPGKAIEIAPNTYGVETYRAWKPEKRISAVTEVEVTAGKCSDGRPD